MSAIAHLHCQASGQCKKSSMRTVTGPGIVRSLFSHFLTVRPDETRISFANSSRLRPSISRAHLISSPVMRSRLLAWAHRNRRREPAPIVVYAGMILAIIRSSISFFQLKSRSCDGCSQRQHAPTGDRASLPSSPRLMGLLRCGRRNNRSPYWCADGFGHLLIDDS